MAQAIPMFNLPILSTNYETIQPMPSSNWMTALTKGFNTVGKIGKDVGEAKDIQKKREKAAQLEAMLNSAKDDETKLAEINAKLKELNAELEQTKSQREIDIASAEQSMQGYRPLQNQTPIEAQPSRSPDINRMQMMEAFGGMTPNVTGYEETMSPLNTNGFTPMVLPQLRG